MRKRKEDEQSRDPVCLYVDLVQEVVGRRPEDFSVVCLDAAECHRTKEGCLRVNPDRNGRAVVQNLLDATRHAEELEEKLKAL